MVELMKSQTDQLIDATVAKRFVLTLKIHVFTELFLPPVQKRGKDTKKGLLITPVL